ncbi:hypothetical protein SELMODRAFT_104898, partial [Selaginella moellendorffii]
AGCPQCRAVSKIPARLKSMASFPSSNFAKVDWSRSRISYMLDVMLERHPMSYMCLLAMGCVALTLIGGIIFNKNRYSTFNQKLEDSFWDAWACVCASSMHLKETTRAERAIGLMLAMCGILVYTLLMGTINAQFKSHMDRLREGAHSQVYEDGHIVICGANNHLVTVLKQINKRQAHYWRSGAARSRKQTVLLLSERPRAYTDQLVMSVKDQPHLNILTRSGSLSSTLSFLRVGADKARTVCFLSNKDDTYEADAEVVLSVLALRPLLQGFKGNVIAEVSKASSANLLMSLSGTRVQTVQNLSAKLFVQCSRQPGLRDVYRQVLSYGKHVINLYKYPGLSGLHYQQVRRGFPEAIICGILREGKLDFHPHEDLVVRSSDKFLVIAPKGTQKEAPHSLVKIAERYRKTLNTIDKILCDLAFLVSSINLQHEVSLQAAEKVLARKERIVILGWRPDVCDMVLEYDDYVGPGSELVILAEASLEERQLVMDRRFSRPLRNITLTHKIGSPMSRTDLKLAITNIAPEFGNEDTPPLSICVIADGKWHVGGTPKADKQSAFALLLAEALCREYKIKVTSLVAEFVDKKLGKQVVQSHPSLNYICTHELSGLVTTQVSENADLNAVWTELLNSWGNEIYVQDIGLYATTNEAPSFNELAERAVLREEVAIGYRRGNKVVINPKSKEIPLRFKPGDALVVIAEDQYGVS